MRTSHRQGAVVVLVTILLVALYGTAALSIDFSRLWSLRNELQTSADAGAHAGAIQLSSAYIPAQAIDSANAFAKRNLAMQDTVAVDSLELGDWNDVAKTFTSVAAGAIVIDAVSVVVSRRSNGLIMGMMGVPSPRMKARAVGWTTGGAGPGFTRFLVDNEMFDPGIQALKDLAQKLGTTSDALLSDGNRDWFVDIPPGTRYEAPTGQVGDEALFDINNDQFPFTQATNPSFADFLNFNEDGSWRQDLIPKHMLDPLYGVHKVDDPARYPDYLTQGACQVSPLYKSDLSVVNVPPNSANALGLRRGLVAFSVDSIGSDPDGPSGSKLPNLWITICDPAPFIGAGLLAVTLGPSSAEKPILVK